MDRDRIKANMLATLSRLHKIAKNNLEERSDELDAQSLKGCCYASITILKRINTEQPSDTDDLAQFLDSIAILIEILNTIPWAQHHLLRVQAMISTAYFL